MSKIQLDISDYHHVKSDKDKTTLKSKKFGHQVTIAHNAVHPDMRKVLESLIDTGDRDNLKKHDSDMAEGGQVDKMDSVNGVNGSKPEPGYTKMAHGGHPSMKDIEHGSASSPYDAGLPCLNPHCKSHGQSHPNCRCYSGGERFAEGGKVKSYCDTKIPHKPGCEYAKGGQVEDSMMAEPTPMEAAQISPETKEQATGMAMGMIGGPGKIAATPEALAPEIRDTASKLAESLEKNGLNHQVTQTLAAKLKGLHNSLADAVQIQGFNKGGEVQHESPGDMSCRQPFAEGGSSWKPGQPVPEGWEANKEGGISKIAPDDPGAASHIMSGLHAVGKWLSEGKAAFPGVESKAPEQPMPQTVPQQSEAPQPGQVPPSIAQPQPDQVQPQQQVPEGLQADSNAPNSPAAAPQPAPEAQPQVQSQDPLAAALPPQGAPGGMPRNPQQDAAMASMNDYKQSEQNTIHDIAKGHITPKTFQSLWHDKELPGKLGMLFGLLIGGFDPAGKGNGAVEALHNIIQNDLQAQQHSAENAQNLLRIHQQTEMNKAQTKNLAADTALKAQTKAQADAMWLGYDHLARMVKNLPEGSPQRQKMEQTLALMAPMIQQSNTTAYAKAAATEAMMKGFMPNQGSSDEQAFQNKNAMMRMTGNPVLQHQADVNESMHIPGLKGQASGPIPQGTKDRVSAMNTLDAQANDLMRAIDQHSNLKGNIDPRIRAQLATKAHETAALYNQTLDGLGMTQGRMDWLEKQIPSNPQAFLERLKGSRQKIEEVARNNRMRRDMIVSGPGGLGFPAQNINTSQMVDVISPSGQVGSIPAANLDKALKLGYKKK